MEENSMVNDGFMCAMCQKHNLLPNYLACGDFICSECFQSVAADCKGDDEEVVPFTCPVCRELMDINSGEVTQMRPKDSTALETIFPDKDTLTQPEKVLCSICSYAYKEVTAVDQCVSCLDYLCLVCSPGHTKATASHNHVVVSLKEIQSGQYKDLYKSSHVLACDLHPDKPLEAFCIPCSKAICLQCKIITHNHHLCSDITEAAEEQKVAILTNRKELKERFMENQQMLLKECDKRLYFARQHRSALCENFIHRVNHLKDELDKCVNELAEKSSEYYQQCIDSLTQTRQAIENQLDRLTSMDKLSKRLLEQGTFLEIVMKKNQYNDKYKHLVNEPDEKLLDVMSYHLETPQVNHQALGVLFGRLETDPGKDHDRVPRSRRTCAQNQRRLSSISTEYSVVNTSVPTEVLKSIAEDVSFHQQSFQMPSYKELTTSVLGKAKVHQNINVSKDAKVSICNMALLSSGNLAVGVFRRQYEANQSRQCDRCRLRIHTPEGVCIVDQPIGAVIYGLVGGRDGEIVVCGGSYQTQKIFVYEDTSLQTPTSFRPAGKNPGGLAINSDNDIVIAMETSIQFYTMNGNFIREFEDRSGDKGLLDYEQMRKYICTNNNDDIFVSIPRNHCVRGYRSNGELIFQYGGLTGVEPFVWPRGITTDCMGHVIVADVKKGSLHVLGRAGNLKCKLMEGALESPRAVQSMHNYRLAIGEHLGSLKILSYLYDKEGNSLG